MRTRGWTARRRALTRLAPHLSRDDVEAAARALAAEAGLEVTAVQQVHERDCVEDVTPVPEAPEHVALSPLADASEPAPEPDDDDDTERNDEAACEAEAQSAREAERDLEERRRAVLTETEAALARGRQWDQLVAGR